MLKRIVKFVYPGGVIVTAGIFPFKLDNPDHVEHEPLHKMYENAPGDQLTGKQRLYQMVTLDEFGRVSSEANSIYQAGFLGFMVGACYGGFIQSRVAYMNFMERNQATAFKSSFEAKRKLQDQVTVNFAKGAFKWGWRLALFTTSYIGIQTIISVYRGKSSIYEYLVAGATTGALYKFKMGLKGMTSGGVIGFAFGGIAGALSLAILKASGTTMEEVRFWQYKWRANRDHMINESIKKQTSAERDILLENHHAKFGESNITLNQIETSAAVPVSIPSDKDSIKAQIAKTEETVKK
ncbi:RPII140-upstream gene protein [Topomyia yanbarensis]|uniref:RPII140-upstream gene protein n=1 Tax=Topomyia yanbarensis TaxID=2498891 RepID=UPI00273AB28E|nr:RPII140-upstream gene protein [Topomyia yanbarensis]